MNKSFSSPRVASYTQQRLMDVVSALSVFLKQFSNPLNDFFPLRYLHSLNRIEKNSAKTQPVTLSLLP